MKLTPRWGEGDRVIIARLVPEVSGLINTQPNELVGRTGVIEDVFVDPEDSKNPIVYELRLDDPFTDDEGELWESAVEFYESELDDPEDLDEAVDEAIQSIQAVLQDRP